MLVGYMQILKELIKFSSAEIRQRVSNFILFKCFFSENINEIKDIKCKSKEARSAAFELLRVVLKDKGIINKVI